MARTVSTAFFALLLQACASAPVVPVAYDPTAILHVAATVPLGCALGLSGPTINPGDAVVYARADALENLALGQATVQLESIQAIEAGAELRYRSVLKQHARGHLEGAHIARVWTDREGRGLPGRRDIVYALACHADASNRVAPWPGFEALASSNAARACAWGFAGPTIVSDQTECALADARRRLAEVLCSDVESILVDFDLTDVQGWSTVSAPADVQARVEADAKPEATVVDTDGTGPLGLKGVAYVLACLP